VPTATLQAALGAKSSPHGRLTQIMTSIQSESCSYAGGKLTLSVGYTAIGNPAMPAKLVPVPGIAHGTFATYAGSMQTQISFYVGSAATGTYGTVRSTGTITKKHLVAIARALARAVSG
jgi:hypothetical protein